MYQKKKTFCEGDRSFANFVRKVRKVGVKKGKNVFKKW